MAAAAAAVDDDRPVAETDCCATLAPVAQTAATASRSLIDRPEEKTALVCQHARPTPHFEVAVDAELTKVEAGLEIEVTCITEDVVLLTTPLSVRLPSTQSTSVDVTMCQERPATGRSAITLLDVTAGAHRRLAVQEVPADVRAVVDDLLDQVEELASSDDDDEEEDDLSFVTESDNMCSSMSLGDSEYHERATRDMGLLVKSTAVGVNEPTSRSLDPEILGLMLAQQINSFESVSAGSCSVYLEQPFLQETDSDADSDSDSTSDSESYAAVGGATGPLAAFHHLSQIKAFIQCVCSGAELEDALFTFQ